MNSNLNINKIESVSLIKKNRLSNELIYEISSHFTLNNLD